MTSEATDYEGAVQNGTAPVRGKGGKLFWYWFTRYVQVMKFPPGGEEVDNFLNDESIITQVDN